jgi:hypothetical protein
VARRDDVPLRRRGRRGAPRRRGDAARERARVHVRAPAPAGRRPRRLAVARAPRGHRGEPWRTFFAPEALAARLRGCGFADVEFLGPAEAEARYFRGRADGLAAPRDTTIGAARV